MFQSEEEIETTASGHCKNSYGGSDTASVNNDFEDFMRDPEEDPVSRANVNIYKDANQIAVETDDEVEVLMEVFQGSPYKKCSMTLRSLMMMAMKNGKTLMMKKLHN